MRTATLTTLHHFFAGAVVETSTQVITIARSSGDKDGLIRIGGILSLKPDFTLNVYTPIHLHGSAIIEGTINMYGGGIFTGSDISVNGRINLQTNGEYLRVENTTLKGIGHLGLFSQVTNVLLNMASTSDINLTISYNSGVHNLEITHADDFPGIIVVDGVTGTLNIKTTLKLYFSSINLASSAKLVLEQSSSSTISNLQMNGNCMISFTNRTSIGLWIWRGGTVTDSSDLTADDVLFTESNYNHIMRTSNIIVKNQLIFQDQFSLELFNSKLISEGVLLCYSDGTINGDISSSLYVNGEFLLDKYTSSLTIRTIAVELSGGMKLSQTAKLSLSQLHSNGKIVGDEAYIILHDSVFTESSTLNFSGILEARGNIDVHSSDILVDKLYCLSGTTQIFQNVTIYIPDVYVYPDCKLLVNGYLNCNTLWMKGGEIQGSGRTTSDKVMWDGGLISIGKENSTSSGLFVSHLHVYATIVAGGRIQVEKMGIINEHSIFQCQNNLTLFNSGTLYLMGASAIENIAVGSAQRLLNYGVIYVDAGFDNHVAKLDIPILSTGNVTVRSGTLHLGMPVKTESSIFEGILTVDELAAVTVSSGIYMFKDMSATLLLGKLTVTNDAEIYMEDCTIGSTVRTVIINGGVLTFTSETEDFVINMMYVNGGNVSLESVLHVEKVNLHSGFLFVRSAVSFGVTILNGGNLHSNKRQSKLTTDIIEWYATCISSAAGKRFPIETREIVMYENYKKMDNSVKLTILEQGRYLSNDRLNLYNGAEIIISSDATFYFIQGNIAGYGSPNGIFTNYGQLIFSNYFLGVIDSYISCFLNNYGLVIIQYMNLHIGNDALLTGDGVEIDDKSKILIEGGTTQLTPDSISTPGGQIVVNGGELLLGPGNYSNYITFLILSGYVYVQGSGDDDFVFLNGMLNIEGGGLNISGVFIFNGTSTFSNGSIEGSGDVIIKNTATFDFVYGRTPSESRTVNCNLFSTEGDISVWSPLTIDSAGKVRVEADSDWHLQSYANLIGDGVLVNTGEIDVDVHDEHICRPSVSLHNYWKIIVSNGKLDLTTDHISLMESGIVEGPHVTLGDNVLSAGHISEDVTINGVIQVTDHFIMTNSIHWISGGFKSADSLCVSNYNPPISSLIIPACNDHTVFNRGYLQIETNYLKYLNSRVDFVNQGTVEWNAGQLYVFEMTFLNEEMGVLNITGFGNHIWTREKHNEMENSGLVIMQPYTSAVVGIYFHNRAGGQLILSMGASIHINRIYLYENSIVSSEFNTSTLSSEDLQIKGGHLFVAGSVKSPINAFSGEINPAGEDHGMYWNKKVFLNITVPN